MTSIHRRGVAWVCALAGAQAAHAQTDQSLLLQPWKAGRDFETEASALAVPRIGGAASRAPMLEFVSTGRARLSREHELNPSLGFDLFTLSLDHPGPPIPGSLMDVSAAFASPFAEIDGWFLGATGGVGRAGPAGSDAGIGWYGKGSLTAGTDLGGDRSLALWVDYDGHRTLLPDTPIPAFAYSDSPSEAVDFTLGFPVSAITWKPAEGVDFSAQWEAPLDLSAGAEVSLADAWSARLSFADDTRVFRVSGLARGKRLLYSEQRLELGIAYRPGPCCSLVFGVGDALRRWFDIGFDSRNTSRELSLGDALYFRIGLEVEF